MEIRESCKGCKTSILKGDEKSFTCCYMHLADKYNCPCRNCVLKTLCDDNCEIFYEFQCLCEPVGKDWA